MNYQDLINNMTQAILENIKKANSQLNCDKTFKAKIVEVISEDKVSVIHSGKTYVASTSIYCDKDDIVRVCVPYGNWAEMYVTENHGKGRTLRDLYTRIKNIENDYVKRDGTNASGTWDISIGGTANKATNDKNGADITTTYVTKNELSIVDYTSQITTNTSIVKSLWSTSIKKIGKNVNFVINITVQESSSFTIQLGNLPTAVRPIASVSLNTCTNTGTPCYVYVNANGNFGFTKMSSSATWTDGDGVRMCFSYVTTN